MGYSIPFNAGPGPDGGTDVLAYPDPLGGKTPHIRVQVKHRASAKASREEIAALRGIIRQDREIGLFVSSAGFTPKAQQEARNGAVHNHPNPQLQALVVARKQMTLEGAQMGFNGAETCRCIL